MFVFWHLQNTLDEQERIQTDLEVKLYHVAEENIALHKFVARYNNYVSSSEIRRN